MLTLPTALLAAALPSAAAVQDPVPLYDNLGNHHLPITTTVPKAQQYFDQGMRLVYGFNHGEAIRAFNEAARLDPDCAMCYWGTAYAYGPHVNAGMDSASGVAAHAVAQKALSLASKVSPREQAFIRAVARRYAAVPPADRAHLDSAYARAMGEVVSQFPGDLDAMALRAEAMMDLRPWNYWKQPSGEPYPGTLEVVRLLEQVVRENPNHPGACHFYIHAVEAVAPQKAVPCAERLAGLMPGVGHMIHMPAHIYIRMGRYADAVESNVHAVHTDETYIEGARPVGVYPIAYYPHNYHFLAFAATMGGRSKQAIEAASKLVSKTPVDVARQVPFVWPFVPFLHLTLVNFGRWNEVLAQPLPPADLRVPYAMAQYARGVALAATGQWSEAQTAVDTVRQIASATPAGDHKTTLDIATHTLLGDIAARRGQLDAAVGHFKEAIRLEDGLLYFEPPTWYYPVRHSLGAVLLQAGRNVEAEQSYREDLKRFPENGWSLFGLAQALHKQGKHDEAAAVDARFKRAWAGAGADITLAASRF